MAELRTRMVPWLVDEAESEALVGLAIALRNWEAMDDPRKESPDYKDHFRKYASAVMRRAIGYMIRDALIGIGYRTRESRRKGFDWSSVVRMEQSEAVESATVILDIGWEAEYEDEIRSMANGLPDRMGEIFIARHLMADSLASKGAARRFRMNSKAVDSVQKRSYLRLRNTG
jgi:DNA-directed RNA polymerase specialized sigma24 family protein